MSDTDTVPDAFNPSFLEDAQRRQAAASLINSAEDDPDKAARAMQLSNATGVPAPLIHADQDHFEEQHKFEVNNRLINDNAFLREYLNNNPMAASISHDDLGNLDELSESLRASRSRTMLQKIHDAINPAQPLKAISFRGLSEVAYPGPPIDQIFPGKRPQTAEEQQKELDFSTAHPYLYREAKDAVDLFETGLHAMMLPVRGAMNITHRYLGREAASVLEHELIRGDIQATGTPHELLDAYQVAQPWLRKSIDPPLDIHPAITKMKVDQAKTDSKNLDNDMATAQKTNTLERSPESIGDFVKIHGDEEIGISADAIQKLYGDKPPTADDNVLGWIPDLAQRLETARTYGGDVWVPKSDYVSKTDPEVNDQLHDFLRTRDTGLNLDEAKTIGETEPKGAINEPLQQVRAMSGLEPMFQVGDRKMSLEKRPPRIDDKSGVIAADEFRINDETGKRVGWLEATPQDGGKKVYIDNIGGFESLGFGPNSFGPALTRSLIRQIKEQYPGVEQIGGFRVSGAREKAGTEKEAWIKVQAGDAFDAGAHQQLRSLLSQNWEELGQNVSALFHEEGKGLAANSVLGQMILSEARRLVPQAEADVAHGVGLGGQQVFGVYIPRMRQLIASLRSPDPIGTIRHESIHALKDIDLFTDKEWATLEKAVDTEGWMDRFNIESRYKDLPGARPKEEAIAEAYRTWAKGASVPKEVHTLFERIKAFLDNIRQRLGEMLGHDLTWEQIFEKVDSGEIGQREGTRLEDVDFQEPSAQTEDEAPFDRGKALGITQARLDRIHKAIDKRHTDDLERRQRQLEARNTRLANREWKERRTAIRDQVREALQQRPDIAAAQFFTTSKFKIHPDFLTDEQKAQLPKDLIQKKDGVNPDDVAEHFGYSSGDALVRRLAMLSEDRLRSGMSPRDYFNRLVDVETDRRLNAEFQGREANDLDTATEQALSEKSLNLIHEETLAYGVKAGVTGPIDQAGVKAMARKMTDQMTVKELDPYKLMQAALRAGKKVDDATSKGNHQEAYRLMQTRQYATLAARIAVDAKRERANLDRLARTYGKVPTKEVADRVDQSYYNYVQETLPRIGYSIRRTQAGLASAIDKEGYKSIGDFVDQKSQALRDLYMPDFLRDPKWSKPVDEMNYADFTQVHNFLKRMDFNARDERQITRAGEKMDLNKTIDDMIARLPDSLPLKPLRVDRPDNKALESAKSWWWSFITLRSMAKRLDRGDQNGLFTRLIANNATSADARETALWKEFSNKLKAAAGKIPDMAKKVENTLWKDPNTGQPLLMAKRNVYGLIGHWGNPSSRTKLLKGWDVEEADAEAWLKQNSTKEDWDRHEKIGDVLSELFGQADRMAHQISGVGIEGLRLEPFTDPHGVPRKGWYNPAKYEDRLPGKSPALLGAKGIEKEGYFRSTPPQGYAKARTGFVSELELGLDAIPMRMRQMIHDIAWRPALLDMGKLIYNSKLQRQIIARYGKHQMEEFKTYLGDMANGTNADSLAESYRDQAFEFFRRNTIGTLIGMNPSTMAKHGFTAAMNSLTQVGPINFSREFLGMFRGTDQQATTQLRMAYDKSEVIQDRMQNIARLIQGHDPKFSFEPGKFSTVRDIMMHTGSFPVAIADFASAVPTWLAEYKKQTARGTLEGPAIEAADRAVIEAHGSAMKSNQPSIMRGQQGSLGRTFTSLYGFFSHMLQKQYEFAWKAKDIWNGDNPLDIEAHWAPHMMSNLWSYWIAPAIIEELITPYTNDQHQSWGAKAAIGIAVGMSSSMAYARDFVRGLTGAYQPEPGLLSTTFKLATDLPKDLMKHQPMSREHMGKVIKDMATFTGVTSGLTNAQMGKTAEYIYRYSRGLERPKGPWDTAVGLRYGDTKGHSRTFKEWWDHQLGR